MSKRNPYDMRCNIVPVRKRFRTLIYNHVYLFIYITGDSLCMAYNSNRMVSIEVPLENPKTKRMRTEGFFPMT